MPRPSAHLQRHVWLAMAGLLARTRFAQPQLRRPQLPERSLPLGALMGMDRGLEVARSRLARLPSGCVDGGTGGVRDGWRIKLRRFWAAAAQGLPMTHRGVGACGMLNSDAKRSSMPFVSHAARRHTMMLHSSRGMCLGAHQCMCMCSHVTCARSHRWPKFVRRRFLLVLAARRFGRLGVAKRPIARWAHCSQCVRLCDCFSRWEEGNVAAGGVLTVGVALFRSALLCAMLVRMFCGLLTCILGGAFGLSKLPQPCAHRFRLSAAHSPCAHGLGYSWRSMFVASVFWRPLFSAHANSAARVSRARLRRSDCVLVMACGGS